MKVEDVFQSYENYETILPKSKIRCKVRPILVKELKILLMGKESDDTNFISSIIQIIKNCVQFEKEIDIKQMFFVDFVHLFLKLKRISQGDIVSLNLKCRNKECKKKTNIDFKMDDIIKLENADKKIENIIKLYKDVGVELSSLTVDFVERMNRKDVTESITEQNFILLKENLICVIKGEERISPKDDEKEMFINQLTKDQYNMLLNWFNDDMKYVIELKFKCGECGKDNLVREVGVISFFDLS